ncbi:hypothetical protein BDB00DRAFT_842939 [Zychaea mexicana]|uniref:uncharacterized protein n=1 Tax=Zychaea mexicana TaxID=64656 RepID=UPI0022FE438C|nr:uncharacterized protein BDB00DRAFT_842939 [Zychaea mexicana]KAI9489443.1 hypothetical protein BDB00DRAFT_842939 [Zychaea mexicana]
MIYLLAIPFDRLPSHDFSCQVFAPIFCLLVLITAWPYRGALCNRKSKTQTLLYRYTDKHGTHLLTGQQHAAAYIVIISTAKNGKELQARCGPSDLRKRVDRRHDRNRACKATRHMRRFIAFTNKAYGVISLYTQPRSLERSLPGLFRRLDTI